MSRENIDISTLAQNLKKGVARKSTFSPEKPKTGEETIIKQQEEEVPSSIEEEDERIEEKKAPAPEKRAKKGKSADKQASRDSFYAILDEINALEGYNNEGQVYVDSDVHEVLKKLKNTTKLKISSLANYLLAEWISQHQEVINEIINQPRKNKFLT